MNIYSIIEAIEFAVFRGKFAEICEPAVKKL